MCRYRFCRILLGGKVLTEHFEIGFSSCVECGRPSYAGEVSVVFQVECAFNQDGEFLALQYLQSIFESASPQIKERFFDIEERIKQLMVYGKLEIPNQYRQLSGRLFEIKTSEDRIGVYEPNGPQNRTHVRAIRMTHGFLKSKNKTPEGKTPLRQIRLGLAIIGIDEKYDA